MNLFEDNQIQSLKDFGNFQKLRNLIEDLNHTNSINDKVEKLSKYQEDEFIKNIFFYTYTDFKQFHVTSSTLKKRSDLINSKCLYESIFDLLEDLSKEKISGHNAISEVNAYINNYSEFKHILYKLFDRNLEIRMTTKLINKSISNLIPTFEVQLAEKYDEKREKKINFEKETWFASRKLDGLRCLALIDDNGDIEIMSRKGKNFHTLNKLKKEISKLNLRNTVLDGEVCIIDEDENEDFNAILKEYKRKNHTIENPKYILFDILTMEEFINKKGKKSFKERYEKLFNIIPNENYYLSVTPQIVVNSKEQLCKMTIEAQENGWEGLIIRKNISYEGKRSKNMLKVKQFQDDEYIVKDVKIGPFRVINNSKEEIEEILTNVIIEHKGYLVSVGSGFSIDERRRFKEHPEKIIGKEITVQYFNESYNEDGGLSLRFPTIKAIYENEKREV